MKGTMRLHPCMHILSSTSASIGEAGGVSDPQSSLHGSIVSSPQSDHQRALCKRSVCRMTLATHVGVHLATATWLWRDPVLHVEGSVWLEGLSGIIIKYLCHQGLKYLVPRLLLMAISRTKDINLIYLTRVFSVQCPISDLMSVTTSMYSTDLNSI